MFHGHDDGWKKCNDCGKLVHYGCMMAFMSYDINENGITCKQCITKRGPEARDVGAANIQATHLGNQATHVGASNILETHVGASGMQATNLGASHIQATRLGAANIQTTNLGASYIQAAHAGASNIQATNVGASNVQATHAGASFPMLHSDGWSELENYGSFTEMLTGGEAFLGEPGRANALNDDVNNLDEATIEGNLNTSEPSNPDLLFLFEKTLTRTDCNTTIGRFLVPKKYAEKFFPEIVGSQSMPFPMEDTQARSWPLMFRWSFNNKSRKYVLDNTRDCIETMQWNAGDKLKFYRKQADAKIVIELEKTTSAPPAAVPGDETSNS